MSTAIIGIDPGMSGGIAMLEKDKPPLVEKMPETERDLFDFLTELYSTVDSLPKAYIEAVHAMPKQGVTSSFTFGASYGGLRMALVAVGIPFETVPPGTWQRAMSCLSKGDKNVTKRRAQELFPSVKVTHAKADALLIAAFGWSKHVGRAYPDA